MTGRGDNPTTENAQQPSFPGAHAYTKVPWLVVYTWGENSEDVAAQVSAQCAERGADIVDVRAVDELSRPENVERYAVIVFVVSAATVSSRDNKSKRLVDEVIHLYRSRRHDGLGAVVAGRQRYAFAGVIHLVVLADSPDSEPGSALTALLNKACHVTWVHPGIDEIPDLFAVFEGPVMPLRFDGSVPPRKIDHVDVLWTDAHAWGVTIPEHVHGILAIIDDRRSHYRSNRHQAPGADHPDHPGCGALDLALDHANVWAQRPNGMPVKKYEIAKKNFVVTGSRAVRETIRLVQEQFPDFRRPTARAGTNYNRPAFYRIYSTLRALQRHLDATTDATD